MGEIFSVFKNTFVSQNSNIFIQPLIRHITFLQHVKAFRLIHFTFCTVCPCTMAKYF